MNIVLTLKLIQRNIENNAFFLQVVRQNDDLPSYL